MPPTLQLLPECWDTGHPVNHHANLVRLSLIAKVIYKSTLKAIRVPAEVAIQGKNKDCLDKRLFSHALDAI